MTESNVQLSSFRLTTPRAAAAAGIIFGILYGTGYFIIQISLPELSPDSAHLSEDQAKSIALGLSFLPFAGIAFLWFIGVIRDRLGKIEDQFFSTLFLGSGLLYLALTFASAAIAGGILMAYSIDPDLLTGSGAYLLSRAITNRIITVYAVRMAGMFMLVLGTIWVRTKIMPRWLAFITYGLALLLLVSIGLTHWVNLIFPTWVLLISVYILILNYRYQKRDRDGLTPEN